jgi:P-type Ca2+ transporter type 2C
MEKYSQKTTQWHNLELPAVFKLLKTSANGLKNDEAAKRLQTYGRNELPTEKHDGSLKILLNQIRSPLIYVMIFALAVSVVLGEVLDALAIAIIVAFNVGFGWAEEKKAGDAISKLKKIITYQAKVLRDGRQILLLTSELVSGDVVFLKSGDKIPADCRIIKADNFQVSEAFLTGESVPVSKSNKVVATGVPLAERTDLLYMGTTAVRGSAWAVVVSTGLVTEIGKIGRLLSETKDNKTPLQEQLGKLSRLLTVMVVILCFFVLVIGLWRGYNFIYTLLTASALAVAAIPEGLLISLTIVLALGMQRILKQKSLVKKLVAAETLGSVSIILTDKTGTLTEGHMQVAKFLSADQEFAVQAHEKLESGQLEKEHDLMLKISLLCSSAKIENPEENLSQLRIIGDPTESALLLAGVEAGFDKDVLDKEYAKVEEIPFDSEQKFMASLHYHKTDRHYHVFAKGAPEKIIGFCDELYVLGKKQKLTKHQKDKLSQKTEEMAATGLRVLALAYKTGTRFGKINQEVNQLVFIGFIALKDPLRTETKEAINDCRRAGIRPIIITGDHPLTARAIFGELGFKHRGNVITGADLDTLTDEELQKRMDKLDIYARVEPHHKLRLVQAWQQRGEVVAMTGDGVNDAPAIKAADIGIALGSGSDVAKETADIILLDNNFRTIVEAVKEGRIIFDNIRKITIYLLSGSFSEVILIAGAMVLGLPLPLTALQILWINLIDHGLPSLALSMERQEDDVMSYPPRRRNEPILNSGATGLIWFVVLVTDLLLLVIFAFLYKLGFSLVFMQTVIFAVLSLEALLCAYSIRSLRHSIFHRDTFRNKYLLAAIAISLLLILPTLYPPLGHQIFKTEVLSVLGWGLVIGLAVFKLTTFELGKLFFTFNDKRSNPNHNY